MDDRPDDERLEDGSEHQTVDASLAARLDSVTQVNRRRLVVNAAANYGRYGVALLVTFFLQAYVIRTLGKAEYSLWPLVSTVTGFVALIPVGIGSGTGRFLAHALGRRDVQDVERITTSIFFGLLPAAALYTIAIIFASAYFEQIFDIPPGTAGIGQWAMLLAGLGGAVRIPFSVYQGGLDAAQQYVAVSIRETALLVLRALLIVLMFTLSGGSLIVVAGVSLFVESCGAVVTWRIARRVVPWQRIRWKSFDRRTLLRVSSFSGWVLVASVAGLLYWQTDNIVINKLLEPTLLTGYSVVATFLIQTNQLTLLGNSVLSSASTILHARDDTARIARMIYRANRITVPMAVPVYLFLALFGSSILTIYLGDSEYASYGVLFAILGGPMILSVTQTANTSVPRAYGRNALNSSVALLAAVANIGLSVYFVTVLNWGLVGVAAGTAIVVLVDKGLFWPWYTARLLSIRWITMLADTVLLPLGHCLPAGIVLAMFRVVGYGSTVAELVVVVVATAAVQVTYAMIHGLHPEDRRSVKAACAGAFGFLARGGR
ncbi:MAG: oligosaccharide flippase family protein [Armatimonadetes bacterium]|nr:oligosaccharide flippase family protein [Armatimonadota bacterium]